MTEPHTPPPLPEGELLVGDRGSAGVRWITIHRPQSRNGLTVALNAALIEAVSAAGRDPAVRVIVLTGKGGAFSSGLDFRAAMAAGLTDLGDSLERYFHGLIRALRAVPQPVIALVDGPAAGFGCDLALACDLRVGTSRASFGEIFVKRGLMPDGGATFLLPRLIGLGRALHLLLTGATIDAEEALSYGLVTKLVEIERGTDETLALAERLAAGPPRALAAIKQAVYGALDGGLEEALATEKRGQLELLRSRDFQEGVAAFLQKREPRFTGE